MRRSLVAIVKKKDLTLHVPVASAISFDVKEIAWISISDFA